MNTLISCCGLNCLTCEARIATMKNDDELRRVTSDKWRSMYNAPHIDASAINCTGCREEGVKFSHCLECEIRNCVKGKYYETCIECSEIDSCQKVTAIHRIVPEARSNLDKLNN